MGRGQWRPAESSDPDEAAGRLTLRSPPRCGPRRRVHRASCYPIDVGGTQRRLGIAMAVLVGVACEAETPVDTDVPPDLEVPAEPEAPSGSVSFEEASSEALGDHLLDRYPASLEAILEKRFLRVVTTRNAFDFFIDQGRRGGFQYEKVRAFTRFLNERFRKDRRQLPIQFELMPVDDDQLIPMLLDGRADLIAARLTITPERETRLRFSRPYRTVDERIVRHADAPEIRRRADLSKRRIAVRASSAYEESLELLNAELASEGRAPVAVEVLDGALATEQILELVAAGRFEYTVADSMLAELAVEVHPTLELVEDVVVRRGGRLAWATLPSAGRLTKLIDEFLESYREGSLLGNMALRKHFEADREVLARLSKGSPGQLSDFDALFKEHAPRFGLDWRLAASMAHQESRFDPLARNRSGAVGLMQIKPKTAREPYIGIPEIKGRKNVSRNVEAGLKYLAWIKARYFDPIPEMSERDRLRMAMGAYNAGPRTILRARARARALELDPDRWFRNVELALLDMGRAEPVKYVSEINQRYLAYVLLGVE